VRIPESQRQGRDVLDMRTVCIALSLTAVVRLARRP